MSQISQTFFSSPSLCSAWCAAHRFAQRHVAAVLHSPINADELHVSLPNGTKHRLLTLPDCPQRNCISQVKLIYHVSSSDKYLAYCRHVLPSGTNNSIKWYSRQEKGDCAELPIDEPEFKLADKEFQQPFESTQSTLIASICCRIAMIAWIVD